MSARINPAMARPVHHLAPAATLAATVTCFFVHVVLFMGAGTAMLSMTLSMLVISGLCVACTWHARGRHGRRDYVLAAVASLTMIVVHLLLMPSATSTTGSGVHQSGMDHAGMDMSSTHAMLSAGVVDGLMQAGIALAAVQLVLATRVSTARRVWSTTT